MNVVMIPVYALAGVAAAAVFVSLVAILSVLVGCAWCLTRLEALAAWVLKKPGR